MIMFFLFLLTLIKCYHPKWAMIYAGPDATQRDLDEEYGEQLKDIEGYCRSHYEDDEGYESCKEEYTSYKGGFISDGTNINSVLQKIPIDTEIVSLVGCHFAEIDFGNLKSQMIVMLEYDEWFCESIFDLNRMKTKTNEIINRMIKSSFNGSVDSFMKYSQIKNNEVKRTKSKNPKLLDEVVSIVGNVKDKVSFLYVAEGRLKFTKGDLNIHTLVLTYSPIDVQSTKIRVNHLIFDSWGYTLSEEYFNSDLFIVDQAGMSISPGYNIDESGNVNYINYEFKIYYEQNCWSVKYTDSRDKFIEYSIPYSIASKFNLITKSNHFSIIREDGVNLDVYKPINLTVINSGNPYPYLESGSLETLTINTENWEGISDDKKPKIECLYDKSVYSIDKTNSNIDISEPSPYTYEPKIVDITPTKEPDNGKNKKKNKAGMIAGITVACVVVVAVVIVVVIFVIRKKKANAQTASDGEEV